MKSLTGHFDPKYHGWDLDHPDEKRTDRFLEELQDSTNRTTCRSSSCCGCRTITRNGTVAGKPTPSAMVAENDLALGRLVEAVSQSHFWTETAIFVVEDDVHRTAPTTSTPIAPWRW